ncbi:hypothetical protein FSP39_016611 [Pinctada imbricata]|uniref:Uncharacterized protein n=1 Tax=Pinctada imbricata TaxID=66713 RepID=A0AA88Y8P7_PINIB|nr:hypothetical protein FSP39_016611 [Pinctada imbricata]
MRKYNNSNSTNTPQEGNLTDHDLLLNKLAVILPFVILFLSLGLYILVIVVEFQRRILKHVAVLILSIYIEILVVLETISLVSQVFHSLYLPDVLQRGYEPFMINSYCLLQIIFLKMTRLDVKPIRYNGIKCVAISTVLLILTLVIPDVLIYFTTENIDKIQLSDIALILYGVYLAACFVISAPKLRKYTRETDMARKNISIQSISRKLDTASNNSSLSTSLRIRTPRIRYSGNMVKLIKDPETSESSNETLQITKKRFSDSDIKIYLGASRSQIEKRRRSAEGHSEGYRTCMDWTSGSREDFFSLTSFKDSPLFSFRRKSAVSSNWSKEDISTRRRRSRGGSTDKISYTSTADPSLYKIAPAIGRKQASINSIKQEENLTDQLRVSDTHSFGASENSSQSSYKSDSTVGDSKRRTKVLENVKSRISRVHANAHPDSGYVADCELISIASETHDAKRNSLSQMNESPFGMRLPCSSSFLSLYRLNQARLLRRLLMITYITSTFLFAICIFKIYKIILNNDRPSWLQDKSGSLWFVMLSVERWVYHAD